MECAIADPVLVYHILQLAFSPHTSAVLQRITSTFVSTWHNVTGQTGISTYTEYSCSIVNGGCEEICREIPAGIECSCREGYSLGLDGTSCEGEHRNVSTAVVYGVHVHSPASDVNECAAGTHKCDQRCANTRGSYSCACSFGFELNSDGHTCNSECACI